MRTFEAFGADHLGALCATGLAAWVLIRRARRRGPDAIAPILASLILITLILDPFIHFALGRLSLQTALPIELCDLAGVACILALWTRHQTAFEFAWFWGLSGTLQALITANPRYGFPHPDYLRYFAFHSGIVVAALYLGPGLGLRPRVGAVWRVFRWTLVYAAFVGLVDWALDANYFFLCRKPKGSLLDLLGPWPYYLLGGAALGAVIFWLLDLPYRRRSKSERSTSG